MGKSSRPSAVEQQPLSGTASDHKGRYLGIDPKGFSLKPNKKFLTDLTKKHIKRGKMKQHQKSFLIKLQLRPS